MNYRISIIAVVLLTIGSACFGGVYDNYSSYKLHYTATGDIPYPGDWYLSIVCSVIASKGKDDSEHPFPATLPSGALVGVYKVQGVDGWDSATGFYDSDAQQPMLKGTTRTIDGIYLWATPGSFSSKLYVRLGSSPWLGGYPFMSYKLSLLTIPTGINYTGPREWGINDTVIALPYYTTNDGTTGYKFQMEFTAPAVPEPSSLLALFSGLAGLGFAVRRKRK